MDTRFMATALLTFAEFLRFDELANLKHFELFIEGSKTDQYREGSIVPIVKSGTDLCPWGNFREVLIASQTHFTDICPRWRRLFVRKYLNQVCLSVHSPRLQIVLYKM